MDIEVVGNLILCAMLLCAPIIFIVANVNYLPPVDVEEDPSEDHNKNN